MTTDQTKRNDGTAEQLVRKLAVPLGLPAEPAPSALDVLEAVRGLGMQICSLQQSLDALGLRKPGQGPVMAAIQAARRLRAMLDAQEEPAPPVVRVPASPGPLSEEAVAKLREFFDTAPRRPLARVVPEQQERPEFHVQIDAGPVKAYPGDAAGRKAAAEHAEAAMAGAGVPTIEVAEVGSGAPIPGYAYTAAGDVYHLEGPHGETLCGRKLSDMYLGGMPPERRLCVRCRRVQGRSRA